MMPKTFTLAVDEKMDKTMDELKREFGKSSKAEVIRLGLALLKIAVDARKKGRNLSVISKDGKRERILLPA